MTGATCDGCGALRFESWPHGAAVMKCEKPPRAMQHTAGGGRVLEYSDIGRFGKIRRPAWCGPGRESPTR